MHINSKITEIVQDRINEAIDEAVEITYENLMIWMENENLLDGLGTSSKKAIHRLLEEYIQRGVQSAFYR